MVQAIYAVMDVRAKTLLGNLMMSNNDVVPTRQFQEAVNDDKSIFSRHPDDFELIRVGYINLETGELDPQQPQRVATARDMLPKSPQLDLHP